jgi:hypothetical protein
MSAIGDFGGDGDSGSGDGNGQGSGEGRGAGDEDEWVDNSSGDVGSGGQVLRTCAVRAVGAGQVSDCMRH